MYLKWFARGTGQKCSVWEVEGQESMLGENWVLTKGILEKYTILFFFSEIWKQSLTLRLLNLDLLTNNFGERNKDQTREVTKNSCIFHLENSVGGCYLFPIKSDWLLPLLIVRQHNTTIRFLFDKVGHILTSFTFPRKPSFPLLNNNFEHQCHDDFGDYDYYDD